MLTPFFAETGNNFMSAFNSLTFICNASKSKSNILK